MKTLLSASDDKVPKKLTPLPGSTGISGVCVRVNIRGMSEGEYPGYEGEYPGYEGLNIRGRFNIRGMRVEYPGYEGVNIWSIRLNMTSLPPLHYPLYYDVTTRRYYPLYYDVPTPSAMTSLPSLLSSLPPLL